MQNQGLVKYDSSNSAMKKTNSMKKHGVSQAQDEQL
jgi:hypothetical protein